MTSRKLDKDDQKICEALFDKATIKYGITDRKFVELSDFEITRLQRVLSSAAYDYAEENGKQHDKYFAQKDGRTFKNYRERLLKNVDEIGCSESVLNSLTLYATDEEYLEWPLYRSSVKEEKEKPSTNNHDAIKKEVLTEENETGADSNIKQDVGDQLGSIEERESFWQKVNDVQERFKKSFVVFMLTLVFSVLAFTSDQFNFTISDYWKEKEYQEKRKQRKISGDIVNKKNEPISSAHVSWDDGFVLSDSTGYFEVPMGLITDKDTLRLIINSTGYQTDNFLYREGHNQALLKNE